MKGKINLSMKARRDIVGYIFVFPALLCFIIFVLIPLILSLVLSFYKTDMFFMDMESVGFANFGRVFRDTLFWRSIGNILLYTLMAVPMNVILSLVLAALVNSKIRGSKVFRLLFYLPSITSTVAASIVWLWLMNPAYGLLNEILNAFGLPDATWLSHSSTALISVTLITVLMPTMYFILTMTLIGAFQLYDQVYVLTSGGPANATLTPVYLIWQNSFGENAGAQAGYAAAQSFILFVIIMAVTFVIRRFDRDSKGAK